MAHHKQEIIENIARNQNAPFKDRLAAWHLICELEAADLRFMDRAVEIEKRRSPVLSNHNHLVAKGSTALDMKLKEYDEEGLEDLELEKEVD
jgi:hypothetical protein